VSNDQPVNETVSNETPAGIDTPSGAQSTTSWFDANRTAVIVAVAVVVVAIVAVVSFRLSGSSKKSSTPSVTTPSKDSTQVNLSADGIRTAVKALGKVVYWAGDESGDTYVLQTFANGQTTVRYVPSGGDPTSSGAIYRLMGSYPIKNAFNVTKQAASGGNSVLVTNSDGSVVLYNKSKMTNVYVAFPKVDVQVEIFDPTPGKALELATSGAIKPIA
jgi:hypothetical protein